MLRIRRVYDDSLPVNRDIIRQVRDILRSRFSTVPADEIEQIGEKLRNPFKQRFRSILFVSETLKGRIQGFAFLLHEPEIGFTYLDWIALAGGRTGGGIGGALYDRVRQESVDMGVEGLFFECLPDDPDLCPDKHMIRENRARLRFYEQYGARPIMGTAYESPVKDGDVCMPHLVYDGLQARRSLRRGFARKVVRAVLERKYAAYCPADYVERVVASFRDNPVRLRPHRYFKPDAVDTRTPDTPLEPVALVVNDRHDIHHVHDRGYVESPVRIRSILNEIDKSGLFIHTPPRSFPDKHILAVHDSDMVAFLRRTGADIPEGQSIYPYVFPIRNKTRPPREPSVLSGYYCIDTFTPVNRGVYPAARRGVDCALTAAREILQGRRLAYALVRPPGHHAERRVFGGFCYFNNAAVAAQYLCAYGRSAILDIDYHHGNGQQDIFYQRPDVLTISIHGHPNVSYPYFSGFADEQGDGDGEGSNLNLPLPENAEGPVYRKALEKALKRIQDFNPPFLVVALGLDTAKGDPTGACSLRVKDFEENGRLIGMLGLPTVVIQEGGYRNRTLGGNVMAFFKGLTRAHRNWTRTRQTPAKHLHGVAYRYALDPGDISQIKQLVKKTEYFSEEEVGVATELVEERLTRGENSGYRFILADHYGRLAGYTCFGRIPGTAASFDLYWIVVHPEYQGRGLGRRLLRETERLIKSADGTRVYVDTSQRHQYANTRAFYESAGYRLETVLADYYNPGDGKAVYCKVLV